MEIIPIHTFGVESFHLPVRFVALNVNEYDFSVAHRHNYFELFFFTKGGGTHLVDFNEYEVNDHSVHIVCPGQVHLLKRTAASFGAVVHFTNYLFEGTKQTLLNSPFLNNAAFPAVDLTASEYSEMAILLEQLKSESAKDTGKHTEIMKGYVEILVMKYLQIMETRHPDVPGLGSGVFNTFRMEAENTFRQNLPASHYAEKLNMTEKQLNKLCINTTGNSVSDYLKQRILLEAKRLLYNSDLSIKEIAFELGFEDPSYFNRFFRKNTELTPGDFRNRENS